ncbi:hypothetical protein AYI70_g9154 [Smittium culicis]|uniref:FHA domain-containing protein n=1 Tax=Smittium culicis TaxID=133412 RepID=A0A1R1XCN4_9FUNG|nr:hypothetical protein AYI70_g9154 [Smittium culicis]
MLYQPSSQHSLTKYGQVVVLKKNGKDSNILFPLDMLICSIGSDKYNHIKLDVENVSERHCLLFVDKNNNTWIRSVGNQITLLNGKEVKGDQRINHLDIFTISTRSFRFESIPQNSLLQPSNNPFPRHSNRRHTISNSSTIPHNIQPSPSAQNNLSDKQKKIIEGYHKRRNSLINISPDFQFRDIIKSHFLSHPNDVPTAIKNQLNSLQLELQRLSSPSNHSSRLSSNSKLDFYKNELSSIQYPLNQKPRLQNRRRSSSLPPLHLNQPPTPCNNPQNSPNPSSSIITPSKATWDSLEYGNFGSETELSRNTLALSPSYSFLNKLNTRNNFLSHNLSPSARPRPKISSQYYTPQPAPKITPTKSSQTDCFDRKRDRRRSFKRLNYTEKSSDSNSDYNSDLNSEKRTRLVRFGPPLSPEIFDYKSPASTPIKRGAPPNSFPENESKKPKSILKVKYGIFSIKSNQSPVIKSTPFNISSDTPILRQRRNGKVNHSVSIYDETSPGSYDSHPIVLDNTKNSADLTQNYFSDVGCATNKSSPTLDIEIDHIPADITTSPFSFPSPSPYYLPLETNSINNVQLSADSIFDQASSLLINPPTDLNFSATQSYSSSDAVMEPSTVSSNIDIETKNSSPKVETTPICTTPQTDIDPSAIQNKNDIEIDLSINNELPLQKDIHITLTKQSEPTIPSDAIINRRRSRRLSEKIKIKAEIHDSTTTATQDKLSQNPIPQKQKQRQKKKVDSSTSDLVDSNSLLKKQIPPKKTTKSNNSNTKPNTVEKKLLSKPKQTEKNHDSIEIKAEISPKNIEIQKKPSPKNNISDLLTSKAGPSKVLLRKRNRLSLVDKISPLNKDKIAKLKLASTDKNGVMKKDSVQIKLNFSPIKKSNLSDKNLAPSLDRVDLNYDFLSSKRRYSMPQPAIRPPVENRFLSNKIERKPNLPDPLMSSSIKPVIIDTDQNSDLLSPKPDISDIIGTPTKPKNKSTHQIGCKNKLSSPSIIDNVKFPFNFCSSDKENLKISNSTTKQDTVSTLETLKPKHNTIATSFSNSSIKVDSPKSPRRTRRRSKKISVTAESNNLPNKKSKQMLLSLPFEKPLLSENEDLPLNDISSMSIPLTNGSINQLKRKSSISNDDTSPELLTSNSQSRKRLNTNSNIPLPPPKKNFLDRLSRPTASSMLKSRVSQRKKLK